MEDLDIAVDFISDLILLCEVPRKEWSKVFRKINLGLGDYMGTGYIFIDRYHKIYDDFMEKTSDSLYNLIKEKVLFKQSKF